MPRRGSADDDLLKTLPEAEGEGQEGEEEGGTSSAEVAVRGKGRTVGDALRKAGLKGQAKEVKGKFNELLKNPTNKITAVRIFPRTMRGPQGKTVDCSEVVDLPPPLALDEIIQHLHDEYGGKKWNITVLDEDGEVVDRRNVDVPGDPKYHHKAEDDFQVPDLNDMLGNGEQEEEEVPEDPMDREIANAEKQSRLLMVERQNATLRGQLAEARGDKKQVDVPVADQIKAALAENDARHRAELLERDKRAEMSDLERRMRDDSTRRFDEMKGLIEKMQAGNPAQSTAMVDLGHKLELLQTSLDNKIDKALGQYRETTNMQINALEKGVDGKLAAIQASLAAMQNRPHEENPMKAMIPLITSSIERSTSGYKEMMGPLLQHMTAKEERDNVPANPLEDTLETLGKFNLLGDRKSGDFGSRVVDFAEKLAPEVLAFVRDEKSKGREVTEAAIRNHLKLQAEKISRDVSVAAQQEIRQIAAKTLRPALPGPTAPSQTVSHQGNVGPSPVGRISTQESTDRQRRDVPAIQPAAATPAAAPAPAAPAPAAPIQTTPVVSRPEPAHAEDSGDEGEGEEEEEGSDMTVEEEMAARVNSTLTILEREMKIRPRQVTWPNAAWDDLPGPVLDQIVFSSDEEDVYKAIQPYADQVLSDRIWNMVRSEPSAKEFIVAGINIIKGWAVELQQKQRAAVEGGAAPAGDVV
jgi:hypothetical protein